MHVVKTMPAAPQILSRLSQIRLDPNVDLEDVTALLRLDAALTARIMRVANSAVYCQGEAYSSIEQALARIGFGEVYMIAGFAAIAQMANQNLRLYGVSGSAIRENSLLTALTAEALAELAGADTHEAYSAGLLRSVGKIALDGIQRRDNGELVAAFNQEETEAMVRETHRLGKKVVVHARGREATLYAARSGVDLIFHANHLDGECIAAMLETGSAICPTLTQPKNVIEFTQPHEPAGQKGRPDAARREYDIGCANWKKAYAAGIPMMTGTDTGFAVTPYGEWNARELELFVDDLGFTPAAALRAATEVNARFMTQGDRLGVLEPGRSADFLALDFSPLENIGLLQDKSHIRAVHIAGRKFEVTDRGYDPRQVTDFALSNWTELYTRERVAELRRQPRSHLAAAE